MQDPNDFAEASTSRLMDVDLTPPKKRAKSAHLSQRSSVEPPQHDLQHDTNQQSSATVKDDFDSTADVAATSPAAADVSVKVEQEPAPSLAEASDIKPESSFDSSPAPTTSDLPMQAQQIDIAQQPPAKKKKTTATNSTTKKESTSSSNSSKTKKSSSSASKKASSSSTPVAEVKPKIEKRSSPLPPPLPITADAEEEEVDNALYCICRQRQDDVEGGMIMCDRCEQWYHYRCMEITEDDVELVDQFICPPCHGETGEKTTYKEACAREGCRRAARTLFSKYCSDRCGGLAIAGVMRKLGLGVGKERAALEKLEADRRVRVARKREVLTHRTKKIRGEGRRVGEGGRGDTRRYW